MLARRVAEAFGSHKTVDERFDQLEAQLTALAKRAKGFKKVVNGYMVDLKKFAKVMSIGGPCLSQICAPSTHSDDPHLAVFAPCC